MSRFPQPEGHRGSLKWIQFLVNDHPELINESLIEASGLSPDTSIKWLSPLRPDQFAEYRDRAFLDRLNIRLKKHRLGAFWPRHGPQWDALARSDQGETFLIESKAHIGEIQFRGTKASVRSKTLIDASLKTTQSYLRVDAAIDYWSKILYQYTNRLAHLYLLRVLNDIPTFMVFLYFVGDKEMDGPSTLNEWKSAIQVIKGVLGLPDHHRLSRYVLDIFIDVSQIEGDHERARK